MVLQEKLTHLSKEARDYTGGDLVHLAFDRHLRRPANLAVRANFGVTTDDELEHSNSLLELVYYLA